MAVRGLLDYWRVKNKLFKAGLTNAWTLFENKICGPTHMIKKKTN